MRHVIDHSKLRSFVCPSLVQHMFSLFLFPFLFLSCAESKIPLRSSSLGHCGLIPDAYDDDAFYYGDYGDQAGNGDGNDYAGKEKG